MRTLRRIFPPPPTFTDRTIPDLTGKIILITGATSGVGYNTASILYAKHATVYITARSAAKAGPPSLPSRPPPECTHSRGRLAFLVLDLAELEGIKRSVEEFLGKEDRLDVLAHNAGVMAPPAGSRTGLGKVGDLFLMSEMARWVGRDGVMSLSVSLGLMKTELQQHNSPAPGKIMLLSKGPRCGAYSEILTALSPEVTSE